MPMLWTTTSAACYVHQNTVPYAPSTSTRGAQAMASRCFCFSDGSLTFDAKPSAWSRRTHCQVMSNCHRSKPCRALRARTPTVSSPEPLPVPAGLLTCEMQEVAYSVGNT